MLIKQKVLFSKQECEFVLNLVKSNLQNWNFKDRKYNSQPINYSSEAKWLFDKLKQFVEDENNIEIKKIKKQIHFHKFIKGDWFAKHNDNRDNRMYAIGVLLNDNFEGGDFVLHNPTEFKLNKIIGNTYIFDVRIEHEIKPIENGERYSLLWFIESKHISIKTDKLI